MKATSVIKSVSAGIIFGALLCGCEPEFTLKDFKSENGIGLIIKGTPVLTYDEKRFQTGYNKEKNTLIQYPAGKKESAYTIPYYVTSIGNDAFAYCSAIKQVTIHNSVTNIGDFAFRDCSALTEITIPNSVTSIRYQAFARCSSLMKVTIPNSVTSIEDYAFYDCSALTEITVLATVPPTVGVDAFYNVSRSIPVYVPADALEDYQAAETWKEFNYLQAMPTTVLQTPSMPESISIYGGLLYNPQQLPVSIYDMQGRMVYSGTAATVSQPAGVYVLRCTGASSKVLF